MQYSTKKRTLFKTISWRTIATLTTAVLVYIFTGEIAIAVTIGGIEVIAKMIFYFAHERVWGKIRYGKKEIPSFVVWITGLPSSGKREITDDLYERLLERKLKVGRIDSRGVHYFRKLDLHQVMLINMFEEPDTCVRCLKRTASSSSRHSYLPIRRVDHSPGNRPIIS